ncbi:hypothetical protein GCM10029964_028250 [Kibdelosporangium lantanae]
MHHARRDTGAFGQDPRADGRPTPFGDQLDGGGEQPLPYLLAVRDHVTSDIRAIALYDCPDHISR